MLEPFYVGNFGVLGPWVEWDGTNHEEILDWVNEVANPPASIVSVSAAAVVFTTASTPQGTTAVGLNHWVSRSVSGPRSAGPAGALGRWKTPDPLGRPTSMDDLLYNPE